MKNLNLFALSLGTVLLAYAIPGCSSDDDDDTGGAGKGGSAGASGGNAGKSGSSNGGKSGSGTSGKGGTSSGGSSGEGASGGEENGGAPAAGSPGTGGSTGGTMAQAGDNAGGASGSGGSADVDCGVPSLSGIPSITFTNVNDDFPTDEPQGGTIASGTYAKTHQDVYTGGTKTLNTKEVLVIDATGKTYQSASDNGVPGAGTYAIVDSTLTLIAGCGATGQFGVKFEADGDTFQTYESDQKRISTWTKQ